MQDFCLEKQKLMKIYNEEIIPFLYSQEHLRQKKYLKFVLLKLMSLCVLLFNLIAICIILYRICSNHIELNYIWYFLLSTFCGIMFYLSNLIFNTASRLKQNHYDFIKKHCFNKILQEINGFKNIVTEETSRDSNEYKIWLEAYSRIHTDISQKFKQYSYEDIIEKEMYLYKSPSIKAYLSKIKLTKMACAKFICYNANVFDGLIISMDLAKKFNNKILLTTNINSSLLEADKLIKIKNISKNFKLYAKNNSDLDFVTPDLISLIENLITCFRTKNINIIISKYKVFIIIKSNKDILNITELSKSYQNSVPFKNFVNEIFALKQLFNYFEKTI